MAERYIFDSNIFVQAKNREYRFDFAAAFWQWIEDAHKAGVVFSTAKVRAEINRGKATCPLKQWAGHLLSGFWLADTKDPAVMSRYKQIIAWAYGQPQFEQKALEVFAASDEADAFVIAAAKRHGMTIVTHEGASTTSKASVLIPHAANSNGVQTVSLYDLLTLHASATFKFKP